MTSRKEVDSPSMDGRPPLPSPAHNAYSGGFSLDGHEGNGHSGGFGVSRGGSSLSPPQGLRLSVLSARSIVGDGEERVLEPPISLPRSLSRQAQTPAWLANEMTSLGVVTRSTSLSRSATPKPPSAPTPRPPAPAEGGPSTESSGGEEDEAGQPDSLTEEGSRMLRHLEQHAHRKEEMQAEEVVNPNRAEHIQRENNRLLHIAMRRENRNARKRSPSQQQFQSSSPLARGDSLELNSTHLRSGDSDRRDSSGSPRFGLMRSDSLNGARTPEPPFRDPAGSGNAVPTSIDDPATRDASLGDDSNSFGAMGSKLPSSRREPTPSNLQSNGEVTTASASLRPNGGDSSPEQSQPRDGSPQRPGKPRVTAFGFGGAQRPRAGSSSNVSTRRFQFGFMGSPMNVSSRRQPGSKSDQGHLPPSFSAQRQRQRLSALLKRSDLLDTTLWEAIRMIRPLHPQGYFRRNWDRLLVVAVMYTMIAVPVEVAFESEEVVFRLIGIVMDLIFIVDIWFAFRTSYREVNDEYVRDFDLIAREYLRTWFVLDLIAALPFNIIVAIVFTYLPPDVRNYINLVKLIKVFRLFRLRYLFYTLAGLRVSVFIYLLIFVSAFVLAAHWFACIFWKIADLQQDAGSPSWASLQPIYPNLFNLSINEQYSISMYWSLSTISTLGYGDVRPRTYPEQIFASVVIIMGASLYAAVIGLVAYIMRSQFEGELMRENHVDSMRTFGRHYNLPLPLQRRIQDYFDFLWERKKRFTARSLVDDLPLELRADVADAVHKKLINNNPVLRACTTLGFKKVLAARLTSSVVRIPEDVLYFEGDEVTEVFFIKKGLVDIIFGLDRGGDSEFSVARRSDGQYLGDMGLYVRTKYTTTNEGVSRVDEDTADDSSSKQTEDDYSEGDASEASEAEEETEQSQAAHFTAGGAAGAVKPASRRGKHERSQRQSLHHTSAMVVSFSEISSILAVDFLQLLEQFPREKALFKAVARARFAATKDAVAVRLGLYQESSIRGGKGLSDEQTATVNRHPVEATGSLPREVEASDPTLSAGQQVPDAQKSQQDPLLTGEPTLSQRRRVFLPLPGHASDPNISMRSRANAPIPGLFRAESSPALGATPMDGAGVSARRRNLNSASMLLGTTPPLGPTPLSQDPTVSARRRLMSARSEPLMSTPPRTPALESSTASPRLLPSALQGLIPTALRGSQTPRLPMLITPEMDDKLVRDTVERVVTAAASASRGRNLPRGLSKKDRKKLKATRYLFSPMVKTISKGTRAAFMSSGTIPQPVPLDLLSRPQPTVPTNNNIGSDTSPAPPPKSIGRVRSQSEALFSSSSPQGALPSLTMLPRDAQRPSPGGAPQSILKPRRASVASVDIQAEPLSMSRRPPPVLTATPSHTRTRSGNITPMSPALKSGASPGNSASNLEQKLKALLGRVQRLDAHVEAANARTAAEPGAAAGVVGQTESSASSLSVRRRKLGTGISDIRGLI